MVVSLLQLYNKKQRILEHWAVKMRQPDFIFAGTILSLRTTLLLKKWTLPIYEAQDDYRMHDIRQCHRIQMDILPIKGTQEKGCFDWNTGKPLTWGEIIERGRKCACGW